ncbi:MAG: flagellar hook-basal body complex protein [Roseibium sp.]
MGIYGAINAAVSGLTAQARALENISGNVANSQTVGYKRLDTTFSDLVSGGGSTQASQVSGTTIATSRATNSVTGDITSSQVDTYLAINGEGYFVVSKAADFVDGSTTFDDATFFTRGGDFEVNKEGYFVNSGGYFLKGYPLDPLTYNPIGDAPAVIQIDDAPLAAKSTETVNFQANLPRIPATADYDGTEASALMTPLADAAHLPDVGGTDLTAFISSSISGGSVTVYNANGSAVPLDIRYAKTSNAADTWNMYISSGGGADDYYQVGTVDFAPDGASITGLTAGVAGELFTTGPVVANGTNGFTIPSINVGGITATNVTIDFGGSLTQYANADGVVTSLAISQDGYAAGELTNIAVDKSGRVIASYSNNQTRARYEIPLATFQADQSLRRVDGAAFAATSDSGDPVYGGGGAVISNAVELSNADIADEFAKLIVTQQAYSANSKIVTSADEMLDQALNMVR